MTIEFFVETLAYLLLLEASDRPGYSNEADGPTPLATPIQFRVLGADAGGLNCRPTWGPVPIRGPMLVGPLLR